MQVVEAMIEGFKAEKVVLITAWGPKRVCQGPQKDISRSILWGCPYLTGLHYKGVMGYPYPNFCLCVFFGALVWGPRVGGSGFGVAV